MGRGRVGLGVLLTCAVLVALAAAHTAALLPLTIRPAPPGLSGAFGGFDLDLHVAGTIAVLALMSGAYALVVGTARALSTRAVLLTVLVEQLLIALAAPLVSTDVFSYQAYARMGAVYGIDPYTHGPNAIGLDPVFGFVGAKWSDTPSVYGPLFTGATELLARLGVATSVLAYKSVALAASLGLVAAIWRCAVLRGLDPTRAVAFVGLSPLLVVDGIGGAHNDLLVALLLTLGTWAMLAGHERGGGTLAALAVGVKLTAGIALPFALAAPGAGGRRLTGMAGALALIVTVGVWRFGSGPWRLLSTIQTAQSAGGWESISGAIATRLGMPAVGQVVADVLAVGLAAVVVALLVAVRRSRLDWIDATGWATLALLVTARSLSPWYVAWLLPFAALARDRRLAGSTLVLSGLLLAAQLLGMIPHG